MIYYLLYGLGQLIALALPLQGGYWLAEKIGSIWFYVNRKGRDVVLDNLRIIFAGEVISENEFKRAAREIFINFAKYLLEFLRLPKLDGKYIKEKIKFINFDALEVCKEKGVILLSGHLGNWELGAAVIAHWGLKLNGIALTHKYKKIDLFFKKQRELHGFKAMPLSSGSVRYLLKKLRIGEALALNGDRDFTYSGMEMNFFGKPALIPKGPAFFSLKTGCPIICTFMIREKDNSFSFFLEKPIYPPTNVASEENIREINKKIVGVLENYIKKHYTQWLMFYQFWSLDKKQKVEII